MSSEARPISSSQFALAVHDLPIENLYSKAKEIDNSIEHLRQSNRQLQEYSDSIKNDGSLAGGVKEEVGDKECLEAIRENELVIDRQKERLEMLKQEVERRGGLWHGNNAAVDEDGVNGRGAGGRLTDEELRRQLEERMGADDDEGMHL